MKTINIAGVDNKVYKETLSNGLTIYVFPGDTRGITLNLTVKYGSAMNDFRFKGEEEYKHLHLGVAHFLEHLTFKMPDGDASDYFASLGSDANAYTTFDHTNYEVWTTSNLKENLSYLIKYVLTPYYNEELVEKEKGIILEEAKRCLDNINRKISYKVNENLFINDGRKNPVIGTLEEIEAITLEDIENAYNYFYKPYNMTLNVFGNVDPKEIIEIAEESLKGFNSEVKEIEYKNNKEVDEIVNANDVVLDKNETPVVSINYKIPLTKFNKYSKKELDIILYLLTSCELSRTSDFQEYLKDNNIIIGSLTFYYQLTDDYCILTMSANTDVPDKFSKEIRNKISNLIIDEEDLIRKKRSTIAKNILMFDNINDYARGFAHEYMAYGESTFDEIDVIKNTNVEQVQDVCEIIKSSNTIVEVIAKKESK